MAAKSQYDHEINLIDIAGTPCNITASSYGEWKVWMGEELIGRDKIMDKAVDQARAVIAKRKVKVEVPFRTKEGVAGFVSGIHAKNGNLLVNINGKRSQSSVGAYSGKQVAYDEDTPDAIFTEIKSQEVVIKAAQQRLREIDKKYLVDLEKLTNKAIDEKITDRQEDLI